MPPRFGHRYKVDYNLKNSGTWFTLPDGDRIWRLNISSPGALSINLLYDKFHIPDGAKFFVYSNNKKHILGAFTSQNNRSERDAVQGFATGLIYNDAIILEYYLPKSVTEEGDISIAYVIQGYRYIKLPEEFSEKTFEESGNCQVNVNCSEGTNWQNEKNAVAMILVNGNRYCTGSLVNTTANDFRPLFLTADHCLGGWANDVKHDALGNSILNHWSFYWHYESPGCNNTSNPSFVSTVGATVVANNSASDFALLRLEDDPATIQGINPYYLGWDRSGNAGTSGVGIHHPSGDVKKIATHNITPSTSNCFTNTNYSNNNFWKVNWMSTSNGYSVTEGGSSGSPLLNNNHRLIGQLYGAGTCPNPNCNDPSKDIANYGKFSVSWTGNNNSNARRRLSSWLDPNNTGATTTNTVRVPPPPSLSGPDQICDQATYTINNLPAGATITWGCTGLDGFNRVLFLVSGQGTPTAIFRKNFTGNHTIYADISFNGNTIRLEKNNITT